MNKPPNFDLLAPYYDGLARLIFGNQLKTAQHHFMVDLDNPTHILVFGGGTGKVLDLLVEKYPQATICYLESSANMISIAKKRFNSKPHNIQFIHHTEQYLVDRSESFDVIVTPFILDVFETQDLKEVMRFLYDSLTPGGKWIHTDFYLESTSPWGHRWLIKVMYWFFWLATGMRNQSLPDFEVAFKMFSLIQVDQKTFFHRMVRTFLLKKPKNHSPAIERSN